MDESHLLEGTGSRDSVGGEGGLHLSWSKDTDGGSGDFVDGLLVGQRVSVKGDDRLKK